MSEETMNSEQIGAFFPDLRNLSRGPLWRLRNNRPARFKLLCGLSRYAFFIVMAFICVKTLGPTLRVTMLSIQIEPDWSHTLMLGFTSGVLTLIAFRIFRIMYGIVRDVLFQKWANETTLAERTTCAKELVADAYSITEDAFIDPFLIERGLKAGKSRSTLLRELTETIESFQKSSFRAAEKMMSEDPKDFVPALKRLAGDDELSILDKWRDINRAAYRFSEMIVKVEKTSRLQGVKERVRRELEQATGIDGSERKQAE